MSNGRKPAIFLDTLVQAAGAPKVVERRGILPGDRLIVATRNSIYSLTARTDGSFLAAGGVFTRRGMDPVGVHVLGCTAGGRALLTDCLAAPGLFLEFGDGTTTTRIRRVRVVRASGVASSITSGTRTPT